MRRGRGRITLFLAGDVMTGRGVDQILPHPCPPRLFEQFVSSALEYVALAEARNGPIDRPVGHDYVWGDALGLLEAVRPDARIVNLETSVTVSEDAVPKGINYRMHPGNVRALQVAGIDCCALANNHVLDWGEAGLVETLRVLGDAGIRTAGAGHDRRGAAAPAVIEPPGGGRVLVFAFGSPDSGIPPAWAATATRPGVNLLPEFSGEAVAEVAERVNAVKRAGDLAVVSIHWGANWGFEVPEYHRRFAHALIDEARVDAVHGHSSHHPKAIEAYRDRPIFYGCGDLINDYEGIRGYGSFRDDLTLMYFPTFELPVGRLLGLEMAPMRIRRFRLNHASPEERDRMAAVLDRECRRFDRGVSVRGGRLFLS